MRLVHDSPAVPSVILLSDLSAHDENSIYCGSSHENLHVVSIHHKKAGETW